MAIYKVRELQDRLREISEDGYPYADIRETEACGEYPTHLSFEAVAPDEIIDYETVISYTPDPDGNLPPITFRQEDPCYEVIFSFGEIFTINHALKNALEYFKECENDPRYSKEIRRSIKSSSVNCRNLEAKLTKFLNHLSPK